MSNSSLGDIAEIVTPEAIEEIERIPLPPLEAWKEYAQRPPRDDITFEAYGLLPDIATQLNLSASRRFRTEDPLVIIERYIQGRRLQPQFHRFDIPIRDQWTQVRIGPRTFLAFCSSFGENLDLPLSEDDACLDRASDADDNMALLQWRVRRRYLAQLRPAGGGRPLGRELPDTPPPALQPRPSSPTSGTAAMARTPSRSGGTPGASRNSGRSRARRASSC